MKRSTRITPALTRSWWGVCAGVVGVAACHAVAQDGSDGASEPPSAASPLDDGLVVRAEGADLFAPEGQTLPEGAYLAQRRGTLHRLDSGVWVFVFDADAAGRAEPPMVVAPSIGLMQMRRLVESRADAGLRFKVSGRVTLYRGRNFLVPTFGSILVEREGGGDEDASGAVAEPVRGDQAPPAEEEQPKSLDELFGQDAAIERDPSVSELVADVEEQAATRGLFVPIDHASRGTGEGQGGAVTPNVSVAALNDTLMPASRGRVTRDLRGAWVFTRDNDAGDGETGPGIDTPLFILPCQALEAIERHADAGRPLLFRMSGTVLAYEGRAYIRPSLLMLDADGGQNLSSAQ